MVASATADPIRAEAAAAERPNIVLIMVDDLGWYDLSCQGSRWFETPNIDALAARGVRFTRAYAASPVCSPSRAAVLTGRSPHRGEIAITDWIRPLPEGFDRAAFEARPGHVDNKAGRWRTPAVPGWLPLAEETLAERLGEAGYATGFVGKWHLGPRGWWPEDQGFDENHGGYAVGHPPSWFDPYPAEYQRAGFPNLPPKQEGQYLTDREADECVGFIERRAAAGEPFFLMYAPYTVHSPIVARPGDAAAFRAKREGNPDPMEPFYNAEYAAMVKALDDAVGRIVQALHEAGAADDTAVVFTSDNGGAWHLRVTGNGPLRLGKGFMYEGGVRVPLIMAVPGVAPRVEHEAVTQGQDLFTTLLAVAGVDAAAGGRVIDGVDLGAVLRSEGAAVSAMAERSIVFHKPHYWGGGSRPASAIIEGDLKLVWRPEAAAELYDLARDPGEERDLALDRPAEVDRLTGALLAWLRRDGALMALPPDEE